MVFHLAAVVSAQAEADYELGRRVNLRGTDAVIDAARRLVATGQARPRVVFTSSVASFSGSQDSVLADDARQVPGNSYGAQKAAAELILADASRRGFLDAVSLRLPTIIVRPGRPNTRRQLLLLRDHARAAARAGGGPAGAGRLRRLGRQPAPGRGLAAACRRHGHHARWGWTAASIRPASAPPSRTCCRRWSGAARRLGPGAPGRGPGDRRHRRHLAAGVRAAARPHPRLRPHEPIVEVVRAFIEDDLEATRAERGSGPDAT